MIRRVRITGITPFDVVRMHHVGDKDMIVSVSVNGELLLAGRASADFVEGGLEYELLRDRPAPTRDPGDGKLL